MSDAHRVVVPAVFVLGRPAIEDAGLCVRYRTGIGKRLRYERWRLTYAVYVVVDFWPRFVANVIGPLQLVLETQTLLPIIM